MQPAHQDVWKVSRHGLGAVGPLLSPFCDIRFLWVTLGQVVHVTPPTPKRRVDRAVLGACQRCSPLNQTYGKSAGTAWGRRDHFCDIRFLSVHMRVTADFMHTDSVLCRLFADLVHTLSSVIVFHSNAAARQAGGRRPFLGGRRSRGGGALAATAAGCYALVGDAAAVAGAAAATTTFDSFFEGEAQGSVVHRVPPPPAAGLQDEGRGVHARAGRGEQA